MNKIIQKFNLPLSLKIMEITLATLFLFPITYTCTLFYTDGIETDLGIALLYSLLYLGISIGGFFIAKVPLFKYKDGSFGRRAISATLKSLFILAVGIVFFIVLGLNYILFAVMAMIATFIGMFSHLFSISFVMLLLYAILNVGQLIFFSIYNYQLNFGIENEELMVDSSFNLDANIWIFLFFFVVTMIYNNQNNITFMMERRGHDQKNMPKTMRKYNLFLVSVISFIIVALIALRAQFTAIFRFFLLTIRDGLLFIIRSTVDYEEDYESIVTESTTESTDEAYQAIASDSSVTDLVFSVIMVIFVGALIYYIYFYRKYILKSFIEGFEKLRDKIYSFFSNTTILGHSVHADGGDFVDHIVSIREEVLGAGVIKYKKRDWNREYKKASQITDESERYFTSYKLVLKWLNLNGHKVKDSDTPLDVYNATLGMINSDSWKGSTNDYNDIMYRDQEVNAYNVDQLCKYLRQQKS